MDKKLLKNIKMFIIDIPHYWRLINHPKIQKIFKRKNEIDL